MTAFWRWIEHKDLQSINIDDHRFGKGIEAGWVWDITRYFDFHGAVRGIYAREDVTVSGRLGLFFNFYTHMGIDFNYELDDDDNTQFRVGYRYIF